MANETEVKQMVTRIIELGKLLAEVEKRPNQIQKNEEQTGFKPDTPTKSSRTKN